MLKEIMLNETNKEESVEKMNFVLLRIRQRILNLQLRLLELRIHYQQILFIQDENAWNKIYFL
jgi:hypothetical protein